jgi:uncharacterized damage-inducible protein DinB
MKELLETYSKYNLWANQRISEVLQTLSVAQAEQTVVSSFSSVRKTVEHILMAETIWLQRLQLMAPNRLEPHWEQLSWGDLLQEWLSVSQQLQQYVQQMNDARIHHTIEYVRQGTTYKSEVIHVIMTVCNHGTYHRGQLITLLRQLGFLKLPQTDFIAYTRLKKIHRK